MDTLLLLKPNRIYRMVSGPASNILCVGCIMRFNPRITSSHAGIPIRAAGKCSLEGHCFFTPEVEEWEELTDEQVMEVMLGG